MQKITPFIWFDIDLTEVIAYYEAIFNHNGQTDFTKISYNLLSDVPAQKVEMATVELFEIQYHFMGTKRHVDFNESFSLMLQTEDQTETDYYWDAFTAEGKENVCGWCTDKYGLSWQITPRQLMELNSSSDKAVSSYAMSQMMKMKKIIIADLTK